MDKDKNRLIILDITRFIAAFSVLIYHYKTKYVATLPANSPVADNVYAITKFGYLGVDLFFLISGFVIFSSALNRSASQFLISRATRIYPTFWICLTFTTLIIIFFGKGEPTVNLGDYVANLTLFHNYLGIKAVDSVYWTLVTEIKFYACIYFLILFNWLRFYRVWLCIWLLAAIMFQLFEQPFFMGWFISPHYSSYFISGIVFCLARKQGYTRLNILLLSVSWIMSLVHAYGEINSFAKNVTFPDRITAMIIVTSFYYLFFLISRNKINLKQNKTLILLGGMTYPLYLLHSLAGKLIFDHYVNLIAPLPLLFIITFFMMALSCLIDFGIEKRATKKLKYFLFQQIKASG